MPKEQRIKGDPEPSKRFIEAAQRAPTKWKRAPISLSNG
jgi:hypothetical protein